jgi:hypothetical protein
VVKKSKNEYKVCGKKINFFELKNRTINSDISFIETPIAATAKPLTYKRSSLSMTLDMKDEKSSSLAIALPVENLDSCSLVCSAIVGTALQFFQRIKTGVLFRISNLAILKKSTKNVEHNLSQSCLQCKTAV